MNAAGRVAALQKEVKVIQTNTRYKVKIEASKKGKKFIVELVQGKLPRVQFIERTLGRGGFGKVVKLIDLHQASETALKVATSPKALKAYPLHYPVYLEKAKADLKKEHTNLVFVHTGNNKKPVGVQDKPLTPVLTIIKLYKSQARIAYEGTLYDGSLDSIEQNLKKSSAKVRLWVALQVLEGIEFLNSKKIITHDLKPQNILFRGNITEVHVSDLGGATHESKLSEELQNGVGYTPNFGDSSRMTLAAQSSFGFMQKRYVRKSEKCTIGNTILWILDGPWPKDEDHQALKTALSKLSVAEGFFDLFKKDPKQIKGMVVNLLSRYE